MTTPRSNFVVEYKTNRRRAQAQPSSIWGTLDLQAVARSIEEGDRMPWVDPPQVPSAVQIALVEPDEPASIVELDVEGSSGGPMTMSSPIDGIEAKAGGNNAFGRLLTKQPPLASARAPKPHAKPKAKTPQQRMSKRRAVLDHHGNQSVEYGLDDELVTLEAENRHLKRLMVIKLREENDRLNSMLRRFGDG